MFAPKNTALPIATAVLMTLPDSAVLSTKTVSEHLALDLNSNGMYLLRISAVGMQTIIQQIDVKNDTLSLKLKWQKKQSDLENVTVVARKPLVVQQDDKTIVDATVLANSSVNAYEVLEKTPGAVVDQDGNVYLNSNTPATIFINGREMKLSSADIASLLKNLPAGSVSKIEILRNPSAKYDAASSGGIVNVVLKKGIKLGSSGSVNASYFQGVYSTQTVGLSLNKIAGKVNSYFSYQFTRKNNFEELISDRYLASDSSTFAQKAYTTYPTTSNYVSAGVDIAYNKKLNLSFDSRWSLSNSKSFAQNDIDIFKTLTLDVFGQNSSEVRNQSNSLFVGNGLSSKYKIDSTGSEWTVVLNYDHFTTDNHHQYSNHYQLPIKPSVAGDGENSNNKDVFVAQSDLTLKLKRKFTLETGFKSTISYSNNSAAYFFEKGTPSQRVDSFQTNSFRYKESIHAAYLQLAKTFYGFTLKPGLRLEYTNISGRQLVPKDTMLSIKRTDVFPYVFLRHNLFKIFGSELVANAIYRRSIKRPYYEILNPFPKYVDQYLFDVGNPRLQPQFTTNYEVNVSFKDFPVFSLGVNQTKDIFSNVTYQNVLTKVAYRTYDNLGQNKELYLRFVGGIPPGGKYFFYMGAQHNFNEYVGFYQNNPLNYKRGSWLFFMFQELKATKTFTINMQGFLRTRALQNFYELEPFGGVFLSVNKSVMQKKANIILSLNDAFKTNQVSFRLKQGNMDASGTRINDTRKLGLAFRYNFGISKPKEKSSFGMPVDGKEN